MIDKYDKGFCGKPIEQHPSSTISGVGANYYKASLKMPTEIERLKVRIEELEGLANSWRMEAIKHAQEALDYQIRVHELEAAALEKNDG